MDAGFRSPKASDMVPELWFLRNHTVEGINLA